MVNAVRAQVQSVDPEIPVFGATSMEDLISKSISEPRFNSVLLASFAGLALILAAVGIYGVIANFLFGVTATDPATFCGVSMLLILVALSGCYIPARRAARVDPMVALRY